MTPVGKSSSKSPRSFTNKGTREVETNYSLSPQCNEKSIEYFDAESIPSRASKTSASTVEIYLRIRPASAVAEENDVYHILDSTTLLTKLPSFEGNGRDPRSAKSSEATGRRHAFTKIFGSETSQAEMFERSIKHRVAEFLGGKSSTIMTYGTRDSGKTYTLFGTPASPGIITRSIDLVFSAINCTLTPWYKPTCRDIVYRLDEAARILETRRRMRILNGRSMDVKQISTEARKSLENSQPGNADPDGCEEYNGESMYAVWLSFAEIYNGNIYDLLDDAEIHSPLRLTADHEGRTYVCSLRKVYAIAALEACKIFVAGKSRMSTAATSSNPSSSRSHTIFTIKLLRYQKDCAADETVLSTLTFCDLAGSTQFEAHQKRSHMREASNINNSLLVLGRCLKAVSQNQVAPFRESKLTRIFQRTLSGQENLSLLVNVVFTPNLYVETQNTFNFCVVARKLLTDPHKGCERSCELQETVRSPGTCDNDVVASLPLQTSSEIAETIGYVDSVAYGDIQEQNRRLMQELETTKSDFLNREYAIRQELADHYSRMFEELEATHRVRAKEIETEGHDLLKWSVKQVESFYKEHIDDLMRHKKRKRADSGDYVEDNRVLYEELEAENAQITSKVIVLKEAVKKLREENKAILCEKNKCSFELALVTEELKKFRQLTRAEIRNWGGNSENTDDDADSLMNKLQQLMDSKVTKIEKKLVETNEYIRAMKNKDVEAASAKQELSKSEDLLNNTLIEMKELEKQLSRKEAYIVTLKHRVQMQERQLIEAQQRSNDLNNENQKCKCDRSTNISFDDYIADSFFQDNTHISSTEKNPSQAPCMNSSIVYHKFDDWITVPTLLATQTRAKSTTKKYSTASDVDRKSFFESSGSMDCSVSRSSDRSSKDDSGVGSGLQNESRRSTSISDNTNIRENEDKCTQTCLVDEESVEQLKVNCADSKRQNQEETLHVAELSQDLKIIRNVIYALNEAACVNERKIIQHECQLLPKGEALERTTGENREIKRDDLLNMIENKMQKYKCEISELTRKLILKEENISRTSRCLERYVGRSKSFETKLSSMHNRLDRTFSKCVNEHLPRIENLEEEVLRKTLQINELNGKIAEMQYKFAKGCELFEKIRDFEIIVNRCQRDKNELCRQLYECSETQLTLEDKLKKLTMKIAERENEVISLKSQVRNLTDLNIANNEKARNLGRRVTEAGESISSSKEDLQCCEDLRKNVENIIKAEVHNFRYRFTDYKDNTAFLNKICKIYDDSQDEIIRLKMQLEHKELEIILLKNDTDVAIQKYETLTRHLQNEIEEKDKRLKAVGNNSNNCEKSLTENNALSFDSLNKFSPTKDQKQLEELNAHETKNNLTSSIRFAPTHVSSEALNESSVPSENSTTSSDEKGTSMKFDDVEFCQIDSSIKANVRSSVCEADNLETEVNFNAISSGIKDKKKLLDWMKVRRTYGKTALPRFSNQCADNNDSETE